MKGRATLGLVCIALGPFVAACSGTDDVAQEAYVRKNTLLLKTIPPPPSGRLLQQSSTPLREDREGGRIYGYWTIRTYAMPPTVKPQTSIHFYRRRLGASWDLQQESAAPSLSYRKDNACLHILADDDNVFVEVDHECAKG